MAEERLNLRQAAVSKLQERGIDCEDIAALVYDLQSKYFPHLTLADCTCLLYTSPSPRD